MKNCQREETKQRPLCLSTRMSLVTFLNIVSDKMETLEGQIVNINDFF